MLHIMRQARYGNFRAICLLTWATTLQACTPALNWREVRANGSGVAIHFPCKPSVYARALELAGVMVEWNLLACSAEGQTWALAFAELNDPALLGPALHALRVSAQRNLSADGTEAVPFKVTGATPNVHAGRVRLRGQLPDGRAAVEEMVVFARGTKVFQVSTLGRELQPEAVETFFASLRAL